MNNSLIVQKVYILLYSNIGKNKSFELIGFFHCMCLLLNLNVQILHLEVLNKIFYIIICQGLRMNT